MKKGKPGFRIRTGSPAAAAGILAFALCIPMQILGYAELLLDPLPAVKLVWLPVLSALLMILVLLKRSRGAVRFSILPVCIGVLGFVFKLMLDPRGTSILHHVSAGVLYAAIVTLWALTALYVIRTKWVLVILFLIPFFKHLAVNDLPVLLGAAAPVPASMWEKELSMLSFMLALSFCALSFERAD